MSTLVGIGDPALRIRSMARLLATNRLPLRALQTLISGYGQYVFRVLVSHRFVGGHQHDALLHKSPFHGSFRRGFCVLHATTHSLEIDFDDRIGFCRHRHHFATELHR